MVRIAKTEDLQDILTLYQQLFPHEDYSCPEKFMDSWMQIINDSKMRCYIAYDGSKPVSSCLISIIPNLTRNQRPYGLIENVITHRNYRQRGYGLAVMKRAINFAKDANCYKIMLLSASDRTAAHQFYAKIGFDGSSKKGFQLRIP